MSDVSPGARGSGTGLEVVRVDGSNWRTYRDVRLAMLEAAPRAFWTTHAEASARPDEEWQQLVGRSRTWLALLDGRAVGSVGSFRVPDQPEDECVLVGMWVDPSARGQGVGERLVRTVVEAAAADRLERVVLEVAHENTAALALYERMGFRPTGRTGVMPHDPSITELEMALAVSELPAGSW
ncbi:GNAT family N-acetyltransferase [Phycicoccus sp. Soil748]|uniref:GNAT family N-acetyltransferase n=1 Tax=Intrasporangiaceae TaxID=85021 RepID=UPI0009EC1871|nr:GNAT family N-acetyltransferase [Phycicoccus sp. Soil748]